MTTAGLVAVVLVLALAAPLALYVLVQAEAENTDRMDRTSAERAVRRDTDDRPTGSADDERTGRRV